MVLVSLAGCNHKPDDAFRSKLVHNRFLNTTRAFLYPVPLPTSIPHYSTLRRRSLYVSSVYIPSWHNRLILIIVL